MGVSKPCRWQGGVIVSALLLCVIAVAAFSTLAHAGMKTVAVSAQPIEIDPACLWPLVGGSVNPDAPPPPTRVPLQGCAPEGVILDELDAEGWRRLAYEQAGEFGERRFTGVRLTETLSDGALVLQVYDSGGGSGIFSSLLIGKPNEAATELADVQAFGFGDRCNGGLVQTRLAANGRLRASANMTPWDIMMLPLENLPFEKQWSTGQERFGAAFDEAPACASCCSNVVREFEFDGADLKQVGVRHLPSISEPSIGMAADRLPLTACLEEAVRLNAGAGGFVADADMGRVADAVAACVRQSNPQ